MIGFNVEQGLISQEKKMSLTVMWGMGLKVPGVHRAGLARGLCPCGISGPPRKPKAAGMERRAMVKGKKLWMCVFSFSE